MRKFIISDIHGLGNVYYSIMNYLDNLSKNEDISLFINGDLIDHGLESAEILLDVIKRMNDNSFNIVYLGGNHEQLMYDYYINREKYIFKDYRIIHNWFDNGGFITDSNLYDLLDYDEEKIQKIVSIISNLDIYHKFEEKINNKNIVLVHASCPDVVKDKCDLKINSEQKTIFPYLWARYSDFNIKNINSIKMVDEITNNIGNENYFTIVGHTVNNNKFGFKYNEQYNFLNIDGGCSFYSSGRFEYNHVPLVEVKDGFLRILTFNNNNEIIYGNYFDGNKIYSILDEELNVDRVYLNKNLKVKKLVKLEDGVIGYEDWK